MSKPIKLLLGISTIWPLAYVVFFFMVAFYGLLSNFIIEGPPSGFFFQHHILLIRILILTILWVAISIAFYLVHAYINIRLNGETKQLWTILLIWGNIWALPLYWYFSIWREGGGLFTTLNATDEA